MTLLQSWLLLLLAILLEVTGTTCMKLSAGFTRLHFGVLMFIFYALSFTALTFAVKRIDMSVSYAVWSGLGTALIALIGIVVFKEPATLPKFLCIGLIIVGVLGLNVWGLKH